jgi:hypothetical protein
MPPVAHPTAEDRQWRRHRGQSRTGGSLNGLRRRDLETVFRNRYGTQLPDDDAGRDDALLMLYHFAHLSSAQQRMQRWLGIWAPWFEQMEAQTLIDRALAKPKHYRADTLAKELNLNAAKRREWQITTIGATDKPKKQRAAEGREKSRRRKLAQRRAQGARPRADYLASSISCAKPWEQGGISRATWYRRHKNAFETSVATALPTHYGADGRVSRR